MINNDQSTLLLYCCEDVKSHCSGGHTVPLKCLRHENLANYVDCIPKIA